MITIWILDRLKTVIVSVILAKLIPLRIPSCNCNLRISPRNYYISRESIRPGIKRWIVIVIFRKLILPNKKAACNHFDDKSTCFHTGLTHCELTYQRKSQKSLEMRRKTLQKNKETLGVLSHHLNCEMKSPHLVDFSWDFAEFWSNFGRFFADFSRF